MNRRQYIQKEVVEGGMSYAEAGRQLGISRQAVHRHVGRLGGAMNAKLVQIAEGRYSGWVKAPEPDGGMVNVIARTVCDNCHGRGAFVESHVDCDQCDGWGTV